MAFVVEHECPQCGAPVELEETHRLFRCPYCEVKNVIFSHDGFRLVLPHKAPDREIIYAPYLRFKGNVFICKEAAIDHHIVDITRVGFDFTGLPLSLGFRPQAMKMKFVTPHVSGSFVKSALKVDEILDSVGVFTSALMSRKFFHRAYIGEALSIIYLPLYVKNDKLVDAVTDEPLNALPGGHDFLIGTVEQYPRWQVQFLATICPDCGWDLDGETDSVVLTCSNCVSAWEATSGGLVRVSFRFVPGTGDKTVYLPFWKISASSRHGLEIQTYADFIRVTNQPKVVRKEWETQDMCFWIPAFKIRPQIFLHLSKQMTVSQENFAWEDEMPHTSLYPVTLPLSEAVQSLKTILAHSIMNKRKLFPALPDVNFTVGRSELMYLPFNDRGQQELIQDSMPISIHKKTLEYGRFL